MARSSHDAVSQDMVTTRMAKEILSETLGDRKSSGKTGPSPSQSPKTTGAGSCNRALYGHTGHTNCSSC
eukprot:4648867-Prymnesium_polylepis.1